MLRKMDCSRSRNVPLAGSQKPSPPLSLNQIPQDAPSSQAIHSSPRFQHMKVPPDRAGQDSNLFSNFTLLPRLPLELRLMLWRYSMPRKIRPPFQKIIHPPVSPASIKVYQAARSRYPNENLRAKLSLLSHALDIPYFNLLDMTIADRIKKAKTELKEWMNTTDTIALSINMPDYIEMLEVKVSRQRLIGDSIKSVIQLLPFNIKTLLIILDYNDSDAPQHLSDIDYTNEPQLQYIQDEVFRIVSAGALSNRFRAQYKAVLKPKRS